MVNNKVSCKCGVIDDTVNIPRNEYEELKQDSLLLEALHVEGVATWDGFDFAINAVMGEMNT